MDERPTQPPEVTSSTDQIGAHAEHDHIAAVFPDREHAEAAVDDLGALGLGSEHLGVAVHHGDPVVFEQDTDAEMVHDAKVKAVTGAPIGFLAGVGLVALAIPDIGVGGMFGFGTVGAAWGAFLGSYIGIGLNDKAENQHEQIAHTALQPGEVLVVLCDHGHSHSDAARDAMLRHNGRIREFEPPKS